MKTLVLDLDETLVFASLEPRDYVDHAIKVLGQDVYLQVRPGVAEFVAFIKPRFKCRIWSTGQPAYVEEACRALGIEWMTIWGRDKCRRLDEIPENHHEPYDKPLDTLGIPMDSVVIVDNAPGVFHTTPENGIPIRTWRGEKDDTQLLILAEYLHWLDSQPSMQRDHWKWATETLIARNNMGRRLAPFEGVT